MASLRTILDQSATVLVVAVAVIMLALNIADRRSISRPTVVEGWEKANELGIRTGPDDAPVVITQFIDYGCPYCLSLAERLDSLQQDYNSLIATVTVNFPLSDRSNSTRAAIAAECGDRQAAYSAVSRLLLENQVLLGQIPWEEFGSDAGVPDQAAFSACVDLPVDSFPRFSLGSAMGRAKGVFSTPTVWINGMPISNPTLENLQRWTEQALNKAEGER